MDRRVLEDIGKILMVLLLHGIVDVLAQQGFVFILDLAIQRRDLNLAFLFQHNVLFEELLFS